MSDYRILPSILAADAGKIIEEAQTVDIPGIDTLHIDVMDGHYVPNLTMGPAIVKSLKKHTRFKLDVHLMISNSPEVIPLYADAGADFITIHQEAVTHLQRQVQRIKDLGVRAGVSLNPGTSLDTLRWVLSDVDLVLIMSVNPGFGGQKFIPSSQEKITALHRIVQDLGLNIIIEVDGGINAENAGLLYLAGARYFVAGTAIFSHARRSPAIQKIVSSIESARTNITTRPV